MYTRRIQISNYGPIDRIDISLPMEGDTPKPVVLVGENGSGKSIRMSKSPIYSINAFNNGK